MGAKGQTPLRFFDSIEDQRDAASQQPSADDGREQFDELHFPHRLLGLHDFPDAALHQDDGQRHRRAHDKPPEKHFERCH